MEPPLPIPNRTVKRKRADDSASRMCESRSPPSPLSTPSPPKKQRGRFRYIFIRRVIALTIALFRRGRNGALLPRTFQKTIWTIKEFDELGT